MNSAGQCFPTEESRPNLYGANSVEARISVSSHSSYSLWASVRNETVCVCDLWSGRSPVQVHPKCAAQVSLAISQVESKSQHNTDDMSGASACGVAWPS